MEEQTSVTSGPCTPRSTCRQFDFDDLDSLEDAADGCRATLAGDHQSQEETSAVGSTDVQEDIGDGSSHGVPGINTFNGMPAKQGSDPGAAEQRRASEWFWSSRWRMTAALAKDLLACQKELALRDTRGTASRPRESGSRQLWEVAAGRGEGGIVVRKGRRVCSLPEPVRLAVGSRVQELALEGERLQYRKLTGNGPETGWVSTSISHKDGKVEVLLVKVPLSTKPVDGSECQCGLTSRQASDGLGRSEEGSAEGDPVASCLQSGTKHVSFVLCDTLDMSLFELLRAELLRIQQDKRLPIKNGIWSSVGHRLPAHDFVLRKLTHYFDAEGLSWASNLYEAASNGCGFHHDGSKYGGDSHNPNLKSDITMIASFGATRDLTLRHVDTGREFSFPQRNGDIFAFYKEVDNDYMHGVHPESNPGQPRISVVIIGRRGQKSGRHWAPRFRSNMPLESIADTSPEPRLIQFSGIFAPEEPHTFSSQELRKVSLHGTKAADAFFEIHQEWLMLKASAPDLLHSL